MSSALRRRAVNEANQEWCELWAAFIKDLGASCTDHRRQQHQQKLISSAQAVLAVILQTPLHVTSINMVLEHCSLAQDVAVSLLTTFAAYRRRLPPQQAESAQQRQQQKLVNRQPVLFPDVCDPLPAATLNNRKAPAAKKAAVSAVAVAPPRSQQQAKKKQRQNNENEDSAAVGELTRQQQQQGKTQIDAGEDNDDPFLRGLSPIRAKKVTPQKQKKQLTFNFSQDTEQLQHLSISQQQLLNNDDDDDDDDDGDQNAADGSLFEQRNNNGSNYFLSQTMMSGGKNNDDDAAGPSEERQKYPAGWSILTRRCTEEDLQTACSLQDLSCRGSLNDLAARLLSAFAERHGVSESQQGSHGGERRSAVLSRTEYVTRLATSTVEMLGKSSARSSNNPPLATSEREVVVLDDDDDDDDEDDDDDDDADYDDRSNNQSNTCSSLPMRRDRSDADARKDGSETSKNSTSFIVTNNSTLKNTRSVDDVLAQADSVLLKHNIRLSSGHQQNQNQQQQLQELLGGNGGGFPIPVSPLLNQTTSGGGGNRTHRPQQPLQRVTVSSYLHKPHQQREFFTRNAREQQQPRHVFLLVDSREKLDTGLLAGLDQHNCPILRDTVPVADFLFVYRSQKDRGLSAQQVEDHVARQGTGDIEAPVGASDFIIPIAVERKRKDDLEQSIEDRRLAIQRWHMRRSMAVRRLLLVEGADLHSAAHRNNNGNNASAPQQFRNRGGGAGNNNKAFYYRNHLQNQARMATAALSASFSTALGGVDTTSGSDIGGQQPFRVVMTKDIHETARLLSQMAKSLDDLLAPCGGDVAKAEATLLVALLGRAPENFSPASAAFWGRDGGAGGGGGGQEEQQQQQQQKQTAAAVTPAMVQELRSMQHDSDVHRQNIATFSDAELLSSTNNLGVELPLLCSKEAWFRAHSEFRETVSTSTMLPRMLGVLRGISPGIGVEVARAFPSAVSLFRGFEAAEQEAATILAAQRRGAADTSSMNNSSNAGKRKRAEKVDVRTEPASILFGAMREGKNASAGSTSFIINSSAVLNDSSSRTAPLLFEDDPELSSVLNDTSMLPSTTATTRPGGGKPPVAPSSASATETQKTTAIALKNIFRSLDYNA